jgi:hypothetical protein
MLPNQNSRTPHVFIGNRGRKRNEYSICIKEGLQVIFLVYLVSAVV